ncbi:ADP-ribosyltransferase [Streptococcus infantis]|uniref:ADP-ribosyltransferase n=1 Tax=Streptococcus infantis TaxID=68892 RepID=UPI0039C40BE0
MNEFYYKLKGKILRTGQKWDLLSSSQADIPQFVERYLNNEPPRLVGKIPTDEYIIASSGPTINGRLRSSIVDESIENIYHTLKKYSTKKDIVVYRGVRMEILEKMVESAQVEEYIDFKEKGFLHTSLVKGFELRDPYKKLRIKIPKGTNAFYVGNLNDEETYYYEVIIQKGAKLKVISIDDYINCELVGTD